MDSNVTLTLDELEEMLRDVTKTMRCTVGTYQPCGCGIIHEILYVCKYHYSLMKSNSNLSMDNSFPIEDNKTFDDDGSS